MTAKNESGFVFIYRLQDTDDRPKPGVKVQEIPFCGAKIGREGSWFDVVKPCRRVFALPEQFCYETLRVL